MHIIPELNDLNLGRNLTNQMVHCPISQNDLRHIGHVEIDWSKMILDDFFNEFVEKYFGTKNCNKINHLFL